MAGKWNLIPGAPWQEAIEQALTQCRSCAVFVGPSGLGPWHHEEMRVAIDRRVGKRDGFRVIPVLLPGAIRDSSNPLPDFLTQATWVEFRNTLDDEEAFRRLVCGIRGVAPGPGSDAVVDPGECPYRGLEFFDIQHAPLFFGRRQLVDEDLLQRIRPQPLPAQSNRFLALVGASGCGKSSLARAGLLARIRQGALLDSQNWPLVIVRPLDKPLERLAVALCHDEIIGRGQHSAELITHLQQHTDELHRLCRQALHGLTESRRVVLLVDQFEEVFSTSIPAKERDAFIGNLVCAATDKIGQTIVVLTLRDDFYGKCALYPDLAGLLASTSQFLIVSMAEAELREAIIQPALSHGCELEAGLVDVLIRDVKNQPGHLPLLQFALEWLWTNRQSRVLRLEDYRRMGRKNEQATNIERGGPGCLNRI